MIDLGKYDVTPDHEETALELHLQARIELLRVQHENAQQLTYALVKPLYEELATLRALKAPRYKVTRKLV